MTIRYRATGQTVAEGERAIVIAAGRLYVRTSILSTSLADPETQSITYRLREIYDDAAPSPQPVNHAPVAGGGPLVVDVEPQP